MNLKPEGKIGVYFGNRLCPFAHRAWLALHEKGLGDKVRSLCCFVLLLLESTPTAASALTQIHVSLRVVRLYPHRARPGEARLVPGELQPIRNGALRHLGPGPAGKSLLGARRATHIAQSCCCNARAAHTRHLEERVFSCHLAITPELTPPVLPAHSSPNHQKGSGHLRGRQARVRVPPGRGVPPGSLPGRGERDHAVRCAAHPLGTRWARAGHARSEECFSFLDSLNSQTSACCLRLGRTQTHALHTYARRLLTPCAPPPDPFERAAVRVAVAALDVAPYYKLLMNQDRAADVELGAAFHKAMGKVEDLYAKQAPAGPFFLGDRISLVDIAILPFLDRAVVRGPLARGRSALAQRPSDAAAQPSFACACVCSAESDGLLCKRVRQSGSGWPLARTRPSSDPFGPAQPALKHYRHFSVFGDDGTRLPRLKALLEAVQSRPSWKATSQAPEFYLTSYSEYASGAFCGFHTVG